MRLAGAPGLLVLADGATFAGVSIGAPGVATGEVVFNTSMTGYQEIATDPSYARQIVTMTSPHIGNYGVATADDQALRSHCVGFVTRSMTVRPSSWRAEEPFLRWLQERGVMVLTDVDTRRLTRHIRAHGAMPGVIASEGTIEELRGLATSAPRMEGADLASVVSTDATYIVDSRREQLGRVVAIDLGIKRRILQELASRGFVTYVVPAGSSAAEILALDPDGVIVSNGPGDPEPLTGVVETLQSLLGRCPVFGVCLGHQVLALALGATTYKLPFGHHGGNHPVRRIRDNRVQITAQNHGFAVDLATESGGRFISEYGSVEVTHTNLNDNTVEGLACREANAFSVQFHPEAAPGPNDAHELFDEFAHAIFRGMV